MNADKEKAIVIMDKEYDKEIMDKEYDKGIMDKLNNNENFHESRKDHLPECIKRVEKTIKNCEDTVRKLLNDENA